MSMYFVQTLRIRLTSEDYPMHLGPAFPQIGQSLVASLPNMKVLLLQFLAAAGTLAKPAGDAALFDVKRYDPPKSLCGYIGHPRTSDDLAF